MFALVSVIAALHLFAKDSGKAFTVQSQQAVVITLASNPSTGYHWHYIPLVGSGTYLRLVSHRYVAPTSGRPGAAGKEIWRFRALAKVKTVPLTLGYYRTSQPQKVARRFRVWLHVR